MISLRGVARGQLATIGYDGSVVDARTYDDGGRMLTSAYNNGVSETRANMGTATVFNFVNYQNEVF